MDHEISVLGIVTFDMGLTKDGVSLDTPSECLIEVPLSEIKIFLETSGEGDNCEAAREKLLSELDALRERVKRWEY